MKKRSTFESITIMTRRLGLSCVILRITAGVTDLFQDSALFLSIVLSACLSHWVLISLCGLNVIVEVTKMTKSRVDFYLKDNDKRDAG